MAWCWAISRPRSQVSVRRSWGGIPRRLLVRYGATCSALMPSGSATPGIHHAVDRLAPKRVVEREVDRLVRNLHEGVTGELMSQPARDLHGRPAQSWLGLHQCAQRGPLGQLRLLGPAPTRVGGRMGAVRQCAARTRRNAEPGLAPLTPRGWTASLCSCGPRYERSPAAADCTASCRPRRTRLWRHSAAMPASAPPRTEA